jgi:chemotaxis protein methyltransferase CheR
VNPCLSQREFDLLQKFIEENCGISIGKEKSYLIESRLAKLLIDSGLPSFESLYERLRSKACALIMEKVIDAITTNETLWYRDKSPWDILSNLLLPAYIEELRNGKRSKVRIWSAACSTGQEPYSTAMCIDNYLKTNGINDIKLSHFEIIATDISHNVLQAAKLGKYDSISIMRGLENNYKEKYFKSDGRVWNLDERIKNSVRFQQFNLQNSFLLFGKFDIVFCRYVAIYFSETLKKDVFTKIASSLEPNGALFIGSSEILSDYSHLFDIKDFNSGIYYRVKGALERY